ncbi:MAG: hypothetical protein ACXVB1_10835 [Pseudobdellovibrionaceae bacterium]
MKALALAILFTSLFTSHSSFADSFPITPDNQMTPGKLCNDPDSFRYPEKIAYCDRDVTPELKREIIEMYDHTFGFHIENLPRSDFKIDHYIPLCVGGANDITNLWPQHASVYVITDPLEEAVCVKMAEGKLRQKDAIQIIVQGKHNLDEVPSILRHVNSL